MNIRLHQFYPCKLILLFLPCKLILDARQCAPQTKLQTVGFGSVLLADTVLQNDWTVLSQFRSPEMVLPQRTMLHPPEGFVLRKALQVKKNFPTSLSDEQPCWLWKLTRLIMKTDKISHICLARDWLIVLHFSHLKQ